MAITLAVGEEAIQAQSSEAEVEEPKPQASMSLKLRKSTDGNIMVFDHVDVNIIVMPEKNKVLAVAKNNFTDDVYDSQDRLFKYLGRKGMIDLSSVRSGNVYGSLEATYAAETFNGADPIETIVFGVGKFIEEEKPYFAYTQKIDDQEAEMFTNPEDSTTLGDVPHSPEKGSLPSDPAGTYWATGHVAMPDYSGRG